MTSTPSRGGISSAERITMNTLFIYNIKSNPFIATTNKTRFSMFCKYYTTQIDNNTFIVNGLREWNGPKTYEGKKEVARAIAKEWQAFEDDYSYSELQGWQNFFEEIGKAYGLVGEFKENGII